MTTWWAVGARLVVGGVWLVAGALKVTDPVESARAVQAYQLLPHDVAGAIGKGLPIVELAVGACLVLGLFVRPAAALSALGFAAFIGAIASVWARGISIDCGCFGGGGAVPEDQTAYGLEIARDAALLAASLALVWRPASPWSLDRLVSTSSTTGGVVSTGSTTGGVVSTSSTTGGVVSTGSTTEEETP